MVCTSLAYVGSSCHEECMGVGKEDDGVGVLK
jgi:hypothetical protein